MFPVVPNSSLNSECSRGYKSKDLKHTSSISHESSVIRQIHFCSSDRVLKVPSPSDSVSAYEFLEKDTLSSGISTAELVTHTSCGRIGIRKSSNGIIKPAQKVTTWIRSIRLSPDVYSHNAIIELNEEKQVRLRITKNIAPGEEVIAWLSEEISLFMNIPFLTPSNIIGMCLDFYDNKYIYIFKTFKLKKQPTCNQLLIRLWVDRSLKYH